MDKSEFKLPNPPIVEAVLDIECDLQSDFILSECEEQAHQTFDNSYPKFRKKFILEQKIKTKGEVSPEVSVRHGLLGFHFLKDDEKQLVQVRDHGYSFNRLAPYTSLDDYLPEIERTWRLFVGLVKPVQISLIRLRYINRIQLPMKNGQVQLDDYLAFAPHLPDEDNLSLAGFLHQHSAVETKTGNQINIVLTAQTPEEEILPVVFDNAVTSQIRGEPKEWPLILEKIQALRILKNQIFEKALTKKCLDLFR